MGEKKEKQLRQIFVIDSLNVLSETGKLIYNKFGILRLFYDSMLLASYYYSHIQVSFCNVTFSFDWR